jgi:tetratricopeptide (TPR) repeat protein
VQTLSTPELSLFYLYAPEDQKFCEALDKHLAAMKRLGWLRTWQHRAIEAGQVWENEINQQLSTADIILLLISADFLASDYCYSVQLKHALQRHEAGNVIVIPVIVRPVDWSITPFHTLQVLPTDGKAVVNWTNRDQAFFDISQGLRHIIEQKRQKSGITLKHHVSDEPLWTIPYRQNRFFTGREHILEQLSSYFSSWKAINTPIAALSGLGGIGKTQVVLEYAYRSSRTYQAVFWVNASSQETLLADIAALADSLGLPLTKDQEPPTILSLVRRSLSSRSQWLLIFDGVSDLSFVTEIIPLRSTGHVLLTTQAPVSKTYAYLLEIEKLPEQEAVELLLRRSGSLPEEQSFQHMTLEDLHEAQRICHTLDGLPLALDQAGAYIEETGCSLAEYHRHYQQHQLTILGLRGGMAADHPASVVTTWSLSFEYIEPRNPSAADLLRACAFLAPEVIPQQIFLQGATHLGPHLASFLTNEAHFDAAIKMLRQFALVRRFPQTQTISLHRLVQIVLKSQMESNVQALWAARVVQAICATFPHKQDQAWTRCSLYIPHVYVCEKLLEDYNLENSAAGALFYRAGCFFHDHAQYVQAEHLYQRSLALQEATSVSTEPKGLIDVLDSLGWLALDQGRFSQAKPFFQQALMLKEQAYGHDHLETARTLHALGRLAQAQYQYQEAETLYQQALQIKERTVGSEDVETATTLHAIGWLLQDQGQYDAALAYYQKTFAIRSKLLGAEHVNTSTILHQLARMAHHQKQYEQAEKLYLQSLTIKEKVLGLEHPFIAIGMDALARLYEDQGRSEEAETFYQNALSIREHYFGKEHHFTAETMHHLACLYQNQGQLQKAEVLLLQSLNIREQVLGLSHPITAISIHQLARLYSIQQHWEQAEIFYQRALAIREQTFGLTHPATQSIVKGYTRLLRSLHRDAEAQALE